MDDEYLKQLNAKINYLQGGEFQDWKIKQIDGRRDSYLRNAVEAARKMTPDACFEATHWLLLYASLDEMTKGNLDELVGLRQSIEDMPK